MSRKFSVSVLKGILIIIGVVILAFTFGTFGVDYDIVTTSYLSINSNYASTVANSKTKTDAYKTIVEQTVTVCEEAYEAGEVTAAGDIIYEMPLNFDNGTLRITYDMGLYAPGDAVYDGKWNKSTNTYNKHTGIDMKPAISFTSEDQLKSCPIVAPCAGTVNSQMLASDSSWYYSGNEINFHAHGLIFRFIHCSEVAAEFSDGKSHAVEKGDVIGYIGHAGTGKIGNTHLHFTVHKEGTTISAQFNPFSVGVWDFKNKQIIVQTATEDPLGLIAEPYQSVSPLSWSYLENMRNYQKLQYLVPSKAKDTDADKVVFSATTSDEGKVTIESFDESLSKYLPDCKGNEKDWFPEGVHR